MQVQQEPALQGQPGHEQQQQEDQTQPGSTAGLSPGLALQPPEWDVRLSIHHEHRGLHHCLLHACVDETPDAWARLARLGPAGWEENHNCPTLLGFARCTQALVGPGAAFRAVVQPLLFPPCPPLLPVAPPPLAPSHSHSYSRSYFPEAAEAVTQVGIREQRFQLSLLAASLTWLPYIN